MLLLIALTLVGLLMCLVYGWALEFAVETLVPLQEKQDLVPPVSILLGMALIAALLGIWSFFGAISPALPFLFSVIGLIIVLLLRNYVLVRLKIISAQLSEFSVLSWILLASFVTYVLWISATAQPTYDTGLYHAQAIHWAESYPAVPGLANLHIRLGFDSAMFLMAPFFAFGFGSYQVPGLIIATSVTIYIVSVLERCRSRFAATAVVALAFLVFLVFEPTVLNWVASPATDLPSAMVIWLVFLLIGERIVPGRDRQLGPDVFAILALSLFAIYIKLSAFPVILVASYLLWQVRASLSRRALVAVTGLASVLFLPEVGRSVILTGYPLFPLVQLNVFSLDFQVPTQAVSQITTIITAWARIPHQPASVVMEMNLSRWLPQWWQNLPAGDVGLLKALLLGLALLLASVLLRRRAAESLRAYVPICAISLAGIAFWFIMAPAPRFGYGFLVTLLGLAYALPLVPLFPSIKAFDSRFVSLAQLLVVLCIFSALARLPAHASSYLLAPSTIYPAVPTVETQLGRSRLLSPLEGDQCWYAAFPCAPWITPGLQMRGTTLQDGFRIVGKK